MNMSNQKHNAGEMPEPRYEFRTFGQDLSESAELMSRLSAPVQDNAKFRISSEIYIISHLNEVNNIKIRDDLLDMKTYIQIVRGLEQWKPFLKAEFPINKEVLLNVVFPFLKVKAPNLSKIKFSCNELVQIIDEHEELQTVNLAKERFSYIVNNTVCEVANVLVNGVKLVSISSESTEIDDILQTIQAVKLSGYENINYIQMIKRVIGMVHKPLAN